MSDLGTWSSTPASNTPAGTDIVGAGLDDLIRGIKAGVRAEFSLLSSVAGTNTITATHPTLTAYYAGLKVWFVAANSTTGATTLNINSLGAKNVFWSNAACGGGEITQNFPVCLMYDGTQFHIMAKGGFIIGRDNVAHFSGTTDTTKKIRFEVDGLTTATTRVYTAPDRDLTIGGVTSAEQATTSGTSIDFTGIPAGTKRITIMLAGVSTNGTDAYLIQLGDAGGFETTGYLGGCGTNTGAGVSSANFTAGFGINSASAAAVHHGTIVLTLQDASGFTWVADYTTARSDTSTINNGAGSKSLSAELTQVRLTTSGGTNTFDAGAASIMYE